jgi:S-formylglutathione hydrolase
MLLGWKREEVAGHLVDVFSRTDRPRFVVLFLHPVGLETLTESVAYTEAFSAHRLACIAPHAGPSWWAGRVWPGFDPHITPEQHLLDNVLPHVASRWGIRPPGVALLGISMGGQAALRLAFRRPELFPVTAGVASAIDFHEWYGRGTPLDEIYQSREQARQDTATLNVHPAHFPPHIFFCADPMDRDWWRGNDRLHEKLAALGIEHECDLATRAGGHSWEYFEAMAPRVVQHLVSGLEKQARRLL